MGVSMYSNREKTPKIAIVIHAFYKEQCRTIGQKVRDILLICQQYQLAIQLDIHITLPSNCDAEVPSIIESYLPDAIVHPCEDFGMDLWPFFNILPYLDSYDWVLKLHTKNTKTELNQVWFDSLIEGLIGSPSTFLHAVDLLQRHTDWVMAGLMPYFVSVQQLMLNNKDNINFLAKLWQLDSIDTNDIAIHSTEDWGFFSGSLYWLKPESFLVAAKQIQQHSDWFKGDYANDGQMVHAVERLITRLAMKSGTIGLLLPPAKVEEDHLLDDYLIYTHEHSFAINHVFMKQLLLSYQNLVDNMTILAKTNLLDVSLYSQQVGVDFNSSLQAQKHFLLIGQFNGYADNVRPIALKQKNTQLIDWSSTLKGRQEDLVSIVIPVLNNLRLTFDCLRAIEKHTQGCSYEIIVVDNGSKRVQGKLLELYSRITSHTTVYHLPTNLNFSIACNYGFSKANGSTVIFLNNDTRVTQNWLQPLQQALSSSSILAVQPKLLYFDGTVQCAGIEFADDGFGVCLFENEAADIPAVNQSRACSALTGACFAIRAEYFAKVGGFDAWYINGQEDIDLCLRLKDAFPNKQLWYESSSDVYHHTYKSLGRRTKINQNRTIFKARWYE